MTGRLVGPVNYNSQPYYRAKVRASNQLDSPKNCISSRIFHCCREPSPNRANPLRYYELPPETFQVLCCEALRQVPGVEDTQVYGRRGQRQLGIDILVNFPKKKLWVAQRKACQPSAARKNVEEAVAEFVLHAGH